jgi:hypothetical protein
MIGCRFLDSALASEKCAGPRLISKIQKVQRGSKKIKEVQRSSKKFNKIQSSKNSMPASS